MTLRERAFGTAVTALRPLLPAAVLFAPRVARASAERRNVAERLAGWARSEREPGRPLLWLHGASAGELIGAVAVVEELRRRLPIQLVVSYFSPSAEPVLPRLEPDVAEPLPFDTLPACRRALEAVAPDAVVFARGDVWPNFTRAADRLGVPLGMVNGHVAPDSRRLAAPARWLTRPAYGRLRQVAAISEGDAERLELLGVPPAAVRVTGDAALDSATDRLAGGEGGEAGPAARLRRLLGGDAPVLLGGSTWREDEEVLLEAAARRSREGEPLALVLVPHEPDAEALAAIERRSLELLGAAPRLWSGASEARSDAADAHPDDGAPSVVPLVVDEVGILAELYAAADLAWVGGGLGDDGLHSVVEPAAADLPVLFGDRSSRYEAEALVRRGGGLALPSGRAPAAIVELLADDRRRAAMGEAARRWVEEGIGAAVAAADLVEELLEAGGRATGGRGG